MNYKKIGLLLIVVLLIGIAFVYYFSKQEMRANLLFFGSIVFVLLVAGLLIASGINYFLSNK
ncbi:hypothetical protein BAU15_07225 [Enterococcus sp. JM4C]|uniref:hypothetical protein n=1 Tax=Candidatus Enterococcus huntleyi TaxID=1857217 RepID=UPI00137B52D0|nr:hypothetical protein [Enterococcus sp. JM4C]KAF1297499.1 hypothetical protein BAU15_07225 [Enterococcus sp. JM4C]